MFKLDDNFLNELGLSALPPTEKNKMLAHIYETLEMRVGMRLAEKMTNEQLDEFEAYINKNDEAGALKWLETNFPNYKEVVAEELEKLKAEIRQVAPQIVAQALEQAQQAPQTQQPLGAQNAQPLPYPQQPMTSPAPTYPQPAPVSAPQQPAPYPPAPAYPAAQQPYQQPYPPVQNPMLNPVPQATPPAPAPAPMPQQQAPLYQPPTNGATSVPQQPAHPINFQQPATPPPSAQHPYVPPTPPPQQPL